MRMVVWFVTLVLLSGVTLAQNERQKEGVAPAPESESTAEDSREERAKKREAADTRRIKQAAIALYPGTKDLLAHLEERDPAAYRAVILATSAHLMSLENAALAFAKENHPEYFELLEELRTEHRASAYRAAVRELVLDHQGILRARSEGKVAEEAALSEWKTSSRLRLLAAKLSGANQDAALRTELSNLVREQERLRRQQIERQAKSLKRRAHALDLLLSEDPELRIKATLTRLIDRITQGAGASKPNSKKTNEGKSR